MDEIPRHLMVEFIFGLLFDRSMFTEIIVYYHLSIAIVHPSGHMAIIVNKKFTSNRSGRTHYGNDGSTPSILSAFTVTAIAYFALPRTHPISLPSKKAAAVGKRSFPLCPLKCRLQITIFNEVGVYPKKLSNIWNFHTDHDAIKPLGGIWLTFVVMN